MKRSLILLIAAAAALVSCQEWEPVFTGKYPAPKNYEQVILEPTMTIAELASMYKHGNPITFDWESDAIVSGQISSSDQTGNFYKSFYIQDGTGGMEVKVGKTSLYSDYKEGQTIYVKLAGLTVGEYGYKDLKVYDDGPSGGSGMVQIGYLYEYQEGTEPEYETSYLDGTSIVDAHIIRGEFGKPVEPVVLEEKDLPSRTATLADCPYIGTLVTIKDLVYADEIFTLVYVDNNKNHKQSSNRVFLSDQTFGVNTWAMSKNKFLEFLDAGYFDEVSVGNSGDYNYGTVADPENKESIRRTATAATVSQYFKKGGTEVVIRTSGYAKFADTEIPKEVFAGVVTPDGIKRATIDVTGVMTLYQGTIQLVVNRLEDIVVNEH